MNTSPSPENDDERPSETSLQASEEEKRVGCVGLHQVFPQNAFESYYKGQNMAKPYTPYTTSTIEKSVETPPEANGEQKNTRKKPYTNHTITRGLGGIRPMMLMLFLTELARLEAHLAVASDGLHIQAPVGALTDELCQAMTEHKAALVRYASLPYVIADGVGILTGNLQEQDITFVAPERQEAWRYKIGVMSLRDGVERSYWPRMVLQARPEDMADAGGNGP